MTPKALPILKLSTTSHSRLVCQVVKMGDSGFINKLDADIYKLPKALKVCFVSHADCSCLVHPKEMTKRTQAARIPNHRGAQDLDAAP